MDSKVIIGTFPVIDLASKGVIENFGSPGPPLSQPRPCGVPLGCFANRRNDDFCCEFRAKIAQCE